MTFWILTTLMALAVAALLALALLRRQAGEPPAAYDLQVYRDQLREIDRDLTRGLINQADADRIRTEVSRRILAADALLQKQTTGAAQPRLATLVAAGLAGAVLLGGGLGLYRILGAPGYGDLGLSQRIAMSDALRATRPTQAEAESQTPPLPHPDLTPDYKALVAELRAKVAERPDDLAGQQLLARHEAASGNYAAAYAAKARAVALLGDAVDAVDHAEQAEMMILATGGYVSPEAEAALRRALEKRPTLGPARFYWGLMMAQTGRPDQAFAVWEATLRMGPPDAPWLEPIRAQIEEMAWRAGVDYRLPEVQTATATPGPSAADVAAAQAMEEGDRTEMIRAMVAGLETRLNTEGGGPEDWGRLINALGVLGDGERAAAALTAARAAHGSDAAAIALIDSAARAAGVLE